jgi:hypothetical protein
MKYMQPPSAKEVFKVSEQEAEILLRRGWTVAKPRAVAAQFIQR